MQHKPMVQDFLNSKFPSLDSLNNVDTVIKNVEISISNFDTDRSTTNGNTETLNNLDSKFDQAYEFLNKLKTFLASPDDDAITELDNLIAEYGNVPAVTYTRELVIQKLKLIKEKFIRDQFVSILNKINDFKIYEITEHKKKCDDEIVDSVFKLRNEIDDFFNNNSNSNSLNQHLDVDLIKMFNELNNKLFDIVNNDIKSNLQLLLIENLNIWDSDDDNGDQSKIFDTNTKNMFSNLIKLQILSTPKNLIPGTETTLWALDCLSKNFQNKFIFHFEGNGETNRIDKPEFAFNYTVGYLKNHIDYIKLIFALDFNKSCNILSNDKISGSLSTWFITSLLIPLRRKFNKEISYYIETENSHLLSHFVTEVKKFDEIIRNDFSFVILNNDENNEWVGLTNDLILNNDKVWNVWLKNEKDFVNERFEEIVKMEDSFKIDYEIVENGLTKPTKSSINLKNLLEGITSNYNSLPLKFQLKFLSEVQLKLLNFYFDTLKNGIKALQNIKNIKIDGISTLERICRIWCSSKYIIEIMEKWGDDIIFIELWSSINDNKDDSYNKTFFESVINGYKREILDKIPKLVSGYFEKQMNRVMKDYFQQHNDWSEKSVDNENDDNNMNIPSSELNFMIQTINYDLNYLQNTVSQSTYNEWLLSISNLISKYFEKNIALVNNFSSSGAIQLSIDVDYVFDKLQLIKSFETYKRLKSIIKILETGRMDPKDTEYPIIDDSELSMLLLRRR